MPATCPYSNTHTRCTHTYTLFKVAIATHDVVARLLASPSLCLFISVYFRFYTLEVGIMLIMEK